MDLMVELQESGLFGQWWPIVGIAMVAVQALLVSVEADEQFKWSAACGFGVVGAVASVIGLDWSEITPTLITCRAVIMWGAGQLVYGLAKAFFSINEMPVFMPRHGLRGPK